MEPAVLRRYHTQVVIRPADRTEPEWQYGADATALCEHKGRRMIIDRARACGFMVTQFLSVEDAGEIDVHA